MRELLKIGAVRAEQTRPLVAVPFQAKDERDFDEQLNQYNQSQADVIEWRLDCWTDLNQLIAALPILLQRFEKPILVTYRTVSEGGQAEYKADVYRQLYTVAIQNGVSAVDIELEHLADVDAVVKLAKQYKVMTIGSKHVFNVSDFTVEQYLEAAVSETVDAVKLAILPNTPTDVDELLQATEQVSLRTKKPLITIAMGLLGQKSRLDGWRYGSQLTFASLVDKSAPGQLDLKTVLQHLNVI